MKLLLDQNLSPRLVKSLSDIFPGSAHVSESGLDQADDVEVWNYAGEHGYLIVSKDSDFNEISLQRGFPPNVIWVRRGNCSTTDIEHILRDQFELVKKLEESSSAGILLLY
ncbi:MAG: DUF5615 family PIN-like protein [Rhodothermales bacterium]